MSESYISEEEVVRLANNAKIALGEELIQEYTASLNHVFEVMQEALLVDTSDVSSEYAGPVVTVEHLRDDCVLETLSREKFLSNVPESLGGLIKVPTVISEDK